MTLFSRPGPYRSVPSQTEYHAHCETVDHTSRNIFRAYRGDRRGHVPNAIFKLRYEVYCLECAFLPPEEQADGMECDEYETDSVHFAAYSRAEQLIGAVRLVQPPQGQCYPFERHCELFEGYQLPPRELSCEVSRLVVRKDHRRRRADSISGIPGLDLEGAPREERRHGERRSESPMLLFGMYREMYRHSVQSGIRYWFAAMERSLARSLSRMGFLFEPIGPQADYYGSVVPYVLDLHHIADRLAADNPRLSAWLNDKPATAAAPVSAQVLSLRS